MAEKNFTVAGEAGTVAAVHSDGDLDGTCDASAVYRYLGGKSNFVLPRRLMERGTVASVLGAWWKEHVFCCLAGKKCQPPRELV